MAKIGFLEEAEGQKSAIRLIFTFGSFWVMLLCSYLAVKGTDPLTVLGVFTGMIGTLCGAKIGQKVMETKTNVGSE